MVWRVGKFVKHCVLESLFLQRLRIQWFSAERKKYKSENWLFFSIFLAENRTPLLKQISIPDHVWPLFFRSDQKTTG